MRTQLLLWSAVAGMLAATSCSKGPEPPKPGTPAFFWNAAKSTYQSGDFVKTNENLQQIVRSDSDFTARARPWAIVMSAGIAQGYAATADAYEAGARMNRANPMPFRKEMSQLRTLANASALEFADSIHRFMDIDKTPEVTLAFENPTGAAAEPPALRKISSGQLIQDSERESLVRAMIQRGVLLAAGRAAGSPNDPAKTLEALKSGEAKRPRAEFLGAMAQELVDRTDLFGPTKLDLPNRTRMLCQEATEALQAGPETKESKALNAKIQAMLKKIKGTS
jgi:hypothetical protein